MRDCKYPNCFECDHPECDESIEALLKRRRYNADPEAYRQKQNDYRKRYRESLPHCDGCSECVLVKTEKGSGFRRLCIRQMRLIEQKVSNSPWWCEKRKEKK